MQRVKNRMQPRDTAQTIPSWYFMHEEKSTLIYLATVYNSRRSGTDDESFLDEWLNSERESQRQLPAITMR